MKRLIHFVVVFVFVAFARESFCAPPRPNDGAKHVFTFGKDDFLLDGKPFQLRSGEIHPDRVPPEYWRHRIRMAKAMGLNTVAVYVFWSWHERAKGVYDFKTWNRDTGKFIDIAKEEGMWVLLRPGPYCCGEWDLGGIPSYLLADPHVKLRCMYKPYTDAVAKYFKVLANIVRPRMVANGGPILMVQIENEYGSYGRRDHKYLEWLKEQWEKNGVKGPFYTADGAAVHYLRGVTMKGVAIGLDPGLNEAHWNVARRMNPGVPVFSSETYPGWLRHWGERDWCPKGGTAKAIKFYMETGKGFNLYMFHGGTNFGLNAGANAGKTYQPDVTSYDYASPVNEQGRPTKEYFVFRDLISSFLSADEKPCAVPKEIPSMSIPSISMKRWTDVWSHVPEKPIWEGAPKRFEDLGQSLGMMLYKTTVPPGGEEELSFERLADYGVVVLDGKFVGVVNRCAGQYTIQLPARSKDAVLEVLVEAMGHINYGGALEKDWKGMFGSVRLGDKQLDKWSVYPMPLDGDWIQRLPETSPEKAGGRPGAVFKGDFFVKEPNDTYFDMSNYKKGYVWVNGHNLGRYWEIGPQYQLYCPACWLKKGGNEIKVLDLLMTKPRNIRGVIGPCGKVAEY